MARAGINEIHVFQAADRLRGQNVNPTVDNVRRELGDTGSRTTINNHLKRWRENSEQRSRGAGELSVSLQQVLGEQAKAILSTLESEAEEKFQGMQEQFELKLRTEADRNKSLETRLKKANEENLTLSSEIKAHLDEINTLKFMLSDMREENQKLRENRASLQATVSHLHKQQKELKEVNESVQKSLEKQRGDYDAMRERDIQKRQAEFEALRSELNEKTQTKIIQAARIRDLEHQIPAMQAQLKKAGAEALRVRNDAQAAVRAAEEVVSQAKAENQVFSRRLAERAREIKDLKQEIRELRHQGQKRIVELTNAVSVLGKKIDAGSVGPQTKRSSVKVKV
jgi:DNA repair exonuclease SbcCD ATPase subunit